MNAPAGLPGASPNAQWQLPLDRGPIVGDVSGHVLAFRRIVKQLLPIGRLAGLGDDFVRGHLAKESHQFTRVLGSGRRNSPAPKE